MSMPPPIAEHQRTHYPTWKQPCPPQSTHTHSALLTDLAAIDMISAAYELGIEETAVFELSVRRLPAKRNFVVAAGLEQALEYLENVRFSAQELAWLETIGRYSRASLDRLAALHFSGDVYAMAEVTVCFADEPILRVVARLPEAQLIESRLLNLMHFQTLIASKAARCRIAAGKRELVDCGMRRAHGADAALFAARASYIAGFDATSNAAAARAFGIPVSSTMTHAFVQAHDAEADAFRGMARCQATDLTLLLDTYDIARATRRAVDLAKEIESQGLKIRNVRIDSGDLAVEARQVRSILDENGCKDVGIFASGGMNEDRIAALLRDAAPITSLMVRWSSGHV